MLDARIYRAALVPVLLALLLAAFSFEQPPRAVDTTFAPDAFNSQRALATLKDLAKAYPSRRPGSASDAALAREVEREFRRSGFVVTTRKFKGVTVDGERSLRTVVAVKPGISTRRIVVMTHRDALASPAAAQLSATAALIELARVFKLRKVNRTLVLVSTSGGSGGLAGAEEFAARASDRIGAALVIGDLASSRLDRLQVVPWSSADGFAPVRLRRTVELALRTETGGNGKNAALPLPSQLARLALPLTLGEQGPLLAHGVPAVLLQTSGERGPGGDEAVSAERFATFGRVLLRSITALDGDPGLGVEPSREISFARKLIPSWASRLLVLALLLPALLASIDSFFRARSRGERPGSWLLWPIAAGAALVPALLVAKLAALVGLLPALAAPPLPAGVFVPDAGSWAAVITILTVSVAGWLWLRPAVLRFFGPNGQVGCVGSAAALALALSATVFVTWLVNPLAAALFLPAAHLWLFATSPALRLPRPVALLAIFAGTAIPVAVAFYYYTRFDYGPVDLFWNVLLLVTAERPGLSALLLCSAVFGFFVCSLRLVFTQPVELGGNRTVRRRSPIDRW